MNEDRMGIIETAKNKLDSLRESFRERRMKGFIDPKLIVLGVLALVLGGAFLAIGSNVTASIQGTQTVNSTAYNVSGNVLTAMSNFGTQFGLVGTVMGFGVVLLVLLYVFAPYLGMGRR